MENFWNHFHDNFAEHYQKAPDSVKNFIDSETIINLVAQIVKKYPLEKESELGLRNIYIYRALGILDEQKTFECLVKSKVDWDTAQLILLEIKKDLEQLNNTMISQPIPLDEIAEAEATLKSLRTMANDQETSGDVTHPSQQTDILSAKTNPPPPNPPRWGSDS